MSQLTLDLLQPAQPSFDNFVPGRNAEAIAGVRSAVSGQGPQIVYLWGIAGSGCTHLLKATGALGAGVPDFDARQSLYVVDAVDGFDESDQVKLFNLINEIRAHADSRLIAAGHAPPASLPLREDLSTRLAWGLVYCLHPLSDDEKAAALMLQAKNRGIPLSQETLSWLMAHLPRDMRTLAAALDALDAYALCQKRSITIALARQWLAEPYNEASSQSLQPEQSPSF